MVSVCSRWGAHLEHVTCVPLQASGPCSTSYQAGCRQVLGHSSTSWGFAASMQQVRHYKSIKKSMKPLNTLVSRLAVQKVLESPTEEEVVQRSKFRKAPVIDSVLPSLPEVPKPPQYRRVGQIVDEYSLELEPAFAVVEIAGTQFKVTTDDVVFVNHLADVAVNEVLSLDRVMLLGSREGTVIGRPYVPNASVLVAVEEHFKDGKVHVFKFKKRNRYKKYSAPRPVLTALRILRVQGLEGLQADQVGEGWWWLQRTAHSHTLKTQGIITWGWKGGAMRGPCVGSGLGSGCV